jgi:hypothetical protein
MGSPVKESRMLPLSSKGWMACIFASCCAKTVPTQKVSSKRSKRFNIMAYSVAND